MSTVASSFAEPIDSVVPIDTLAEVVDRLGGVPLSRIRSVPPPGTATEQDLILLAEKHKILCELVDGVLVEKPMGFYESRVAARVIFVLEGYLELNPIAIVAGESGPMRTTPGQVRMPDVSLVLCNRVSVEMLKTQKVLHVPPDLAVEVLSETNTKREMSRKLREYFEAGASLVWYIDPVEESALVYTGPESGTPVSGDQELRGGDLLPGFAVRLSDVFAHAKRGLSPQLLLAAAHPKK